MLYVVLGGAVLGRYMGRFFVFFMLYGQLAGFFIAIWPAWRCLDAPLVYWSRGRFCMAGLGRFGKAFDAPQIFSKRWAGFRPGR